MVSNEVTVIPLGTVSTYCIEDKCCPGYLVKYKEALKKGKDVPIGYMLLIGSRNYTIIGEDGREKLISAKDVPVKNWLLYINDWINQENERTKTTLRAIEIEADVILLAKAIDGIYDSDPKLNPEAKKYDEISIQETIDKRLAAVDLAASILCMENKMPMLVFGLNEKNSIVETMKGNFTGTKVTV